MTFQIALHIQGDLPAVLRTCDMEVPKGDEQSPHDKLVHVLSAQCRALAATGRASFLVGGFGQDPWPVDVQTDLAVVLEQLPDVLSSLRGGEETFCLNFYEQGIERYLTGTKHGEDVTLECMSLSLRWSPDPSVEVLGIVEVERMLRKLRDVYTATVETICPWLTQEPSFKRWSREAGAS